MSRALAKSLKKASEQPELDASSSLGALWHEMKETGLAQSKAQEAFAVSCTEMCTALESQIVEVKKHKTLLHERWTRMLADVKKKAAAHDKAKDQYYESVKQAETAIMNRDAAHEQKMPDKAIQKAETRAKQALKEVDTLHAAYQKGVQQLQEAQQTHDVTCVDLLQQFEKLERARMAVFLEQMRRFATQHDTLKAQLDSIAASLHTHCNAVNIDADMQEFIRATATGKAPAAHVEYVPCKSQILDHASGGAAPGSSASGASLAVPAVGVVPSSPAAGSSSQGGGSFGQAPPSPAAAAGASSAEAAAAAPPAAPPAAPAAAASGATAIALYDFGDGQSEPDDLPFKAGNVIRLLACGDADDWWQGEMGGRVGIFPKAYVQKQGEGAAPPSGDAAPAAAAVASEAAPVAPAAAPDAVPAANPFGDDNANFGGESQAPLASPGAPGAAAAAAGDAGAAEAPKLLDAHCAALFDFDGADEDELSFKAGQTLIITGELNGWYLGRVEGSEKIGIFPSNFVQMNQ